MIHSVTTALATAAQSALAPRQTAKESSAQYDFAEIFGAASDERSAATAAPAASSAGAAFASRARLLATIANATTVKAAAATATDVTAATTPATTAASAAAASSSTTAASGTAGGVTTPGIQALVSAIMNGTFSGTNVTDPSQLQETTPAGTDTMPNFYYASDQTAAQLAQLLGGKVVQMPAFGQDKGWTEPNANFIELPNGQTFIAADVAYYSRCGVQGPAQLTADITQTINEGAAWTNYYQNGGAMPGFATGYVGPAITGMTYASGSIGADGNVINPAMQTPGTPGT